MTARNSRWGCGCGCFLLLVAFVAGSVDKEALCQKEFESHQKPLGLVQVTPAPHPLAQPPVYPRILCFLYTISPWHATRAQAVVDTWGQRCNKLVVFSNDTHNFSVSGTDLTNPIAKTALSNVEVVVLDVPADYAHLWQRHRAGLQYVYDHFREDFDWFYKADDDTYVIVENLREYLKRPEIMMQFQVMPMQLGHRFNMTVEAINYYVNKFDQELKEEYHQRFDRWVFNSGGSGYAMNGLYLDQLIESLSKKTCFADSESQTVPEDTSTTFCMMWNNVFPWDTRDLKGRERFHAFNPRDTYFVNVGDPEFWFVQYHNEIGGVKPGDDCCAPDSIAYHYMSPNAMYYAERQLYFCRSDAPTVDAFNQAYSLSISERLLTTPE